MSRQSHVFGSSSENPSSFTEHTISVDVPLGSLQHSLPDAEADDRDEDEKILTVLYRGGFLGIAVYTVESEELVVYQDIPDSPPDFSYLNMLLQEIFPRVIVRSSKEDENVGKAIRKFACCSVDEDTDETSHDESQISKETRHSRVKVEVLPNCAFSLEQARARILQIRFEDDNSTSAEEEMLKIVSVLPQLIPAAESPSASIQAAGALLYLLDRWRNSKDIERAMEGRRYRIRSIGSEALKSLLRIDQDTLKGLKIFVQDCHPSAYRSNYVKEGFSLFEVMNKCKSSVGSSMLRSLFMRPTRDPEELEKRHKAIDFLRNPANNDVLATLSETLQRVKKINRVLAKLEYCTLSIQEWSTLYETASSLASIIHLCQKLPQDIEIFAKLGALALSNEPYRVARAIQHIIDFDKSKELEQFTVKPGIDANLDELRKKYSELPGLLAKVNVEEEKSLPIRAECAIVYYPEIGFLLGIPQANSPTSPGSLMITGYQFMFTANEQAFYKSARCKELDDTIGDIHVYILDLETRLCKRLCSAICEHSSTLVSAVKLTAMLDCFVSLAIAAVEYHLVKPKFLPREENGSSSLHVVEGRNLLQEMALDCFVPNTTYMTSSSSRVHILSGPNASGKSVYIKQVGMVVFLAHIGSFVPAREMSLTPCDAIYSRLNTSDSVCTGLSSFAKDLNQVSYALRNASAESLVLIDEFGIGTTEMDGKSLLVATLNHWLRQKPASPLIVAATHFHDISALLEPSAQLGFKRMDFVESDGDIVPLFKVVDGQQRSSFARALALKMGLPKEILERADEVSLAWSAGTPIPMKDDEELDSLMERYDEIIRAAFAVKQADFLAFITSLVDDAARLPTRRSTATPRSTASGRSSKGSASSSSSA